MSNVIDLTDMQKSQEVFLQFLESKPNMINVKNKFGVSRAQTLSILSEVIGVLSETKIHKWWDLGQVNQEKLLEKLVESFSHISNIATQFNVDLIIEKEIEPIESLESQFLKITGNIIQLPFIKKYFAKKKIELIFYQYIQLVCGLGFSKEDLETAYYKKLEKNYIKFNNQEDSLMDELRHVLGELYEEFGHTEVTQRLSEILDEYIAIQQRESLECYKQLQEQKI